MIFARFVRAIGLRLMLLSSSCRFLPALLLWLALGLGGAYWTFGLSLLVAAYPVWFLVAQAPRVERCTGCGAEYVDFRRGPRV